MARSQQPRIKQQRPRNRTSKASNNPTTTTTQETPSYSPQQDDVTPSTTSDFSPYNLSQAHFTAIMVMTLAVTHVLESRHAIHEGVSSEICGKIYKGLQAANNSTTDGSVGEEEADTNWMTCSEVDISLFTIKCHTAYIRIALTIVMSTLCWGYEPLLKSWNIASAICPYFVNFAGLLVYRKELVGGEKFSCFALVIVLLFVNWNKRYPMRTPLSVFEGMHNIALFLIGTGMSYVITGHLQQGLDGFTTLNSAEDVPDVEDDVMSAIVSGRKAVWSMMVLVDYGTICIIALFGLLYFDELRKRILLAFFTMTSFVCAFKHLPLQRDYWIDAPERQSFIMATIVLMLLGTIFPSFNGITMKK